MLGREMNYYGLLSKDQNSNFPLTQYVKNLAIRASWRHVQPTESTWNWRAVDLAFSTLPPNGIASLSIHCGSDTPDWLMSQVPTFSMSDGVRFPAPWDSQFLAALDNLIEAVANKYNSEKRIIRVIIAGLCAMTVETTLENIGTRFGSPSLNITQAQMLNYWNSVGYTGQNALYAVQQNVLSMNKYLTAPISISYQPSNSGLDFDTINGPSTIGAIQTWFSRQPKSVIYNGGASFNWVYPKRYFPYNRYAYQEVGALGSQKLFNQMMVLINQQSVNDIEVYAQDLKYVPNVPASLNTYSEEEYTGEIDPDQVDEEPE